MDFLRVSVRTGKKGLLEIYPKFVAKSGEDLMIRGGDFYAIWNEEKGLWSTSQNDAVDMIDSELDKYKEDHPEYEGARVLHMWDVDSGMIDKWHKYVQKQLIDNYHALDKKIIFSNTPVNKKDYASKRLSYALEEGDISAWDELIGTLYSPEDRHKIEWAIGSIVSGDSKELQKFLVFYGSSGTGKSTVLNIVQELFDGYYSMFDAKALGSSSASFVLEPFKNNPLVAIQHDGDLSRIEDNTRLNSIVSHEKMTVDLKFKSQYVDKFQAMLMMGTNRPVKITDSKSGIIRRLIDVNPSGNLVSKRKYNRLMNQISFELGAIAKHCLDIYEEDKTYYDDYIPVSMISATNDMYNFIEEYYFDFTNSDPMTLNEAWRLYKTYCVDANIGHPMMKRTFKEELKTYYDDYKDRARLDGQSLYSAYFGFKKDKFASEKSSKDKSSEEADISWLDLSEQESIFDKECANCIAQYATASEKPKKKWENVDTILCDLDTHKLHYVRVPENHIVIDFDIKDKDGNKSYELNKKAAEQWPETYAELSKGGEGIHLHYIYGGDVSRLSRVFDENIEIKVFSGNASLRRRLSKCNALPIKKINSGLPMKGAKKMVNFDTVKNEKAIRTIIFDCLEKKHHGATKPEVDFIFKVLQDAYESGMTYDVRDLRPRILAFANNSTNQASACLDLVTEMHFCSEEKEAVSENAEPEKEKPIVFFDVEVFVNLFVVCWKAIGAKKVVKMINPTPKEVTDLVNNFRLVGFNNRRYDNHILYARMLGYQNDELYSLSQRIVSGSSNGYFLEAYNISYTDIYDFCSKKQSLKKWEIELDIHHQELGLPWDEPVPKDMWALVADYCVNDVVATEAVWNARHQDFIAREILADISGLSINSTTNSHTTRLIVGTDPNPQKKFVYTDLSEMFPGYKFEFGKSTYKDEEVGEGGYVYSEPGMYKAVALLDIASMHPNSAINLNIFGPYTKNFAELVQARIFIKHGDYDAAGNLFDGKLKPYLENKDQAKTLAYALKIAINSVYGLTAAKFDNKLRDPRNIDNIVAKRGALFMIDLKGEVQKRGYTVAHIKTDSIKIPDADKEIIDFVMEFGKKYGYTFEHEATYDRMCLVNDAVYIAKYAEGEWCKEKYGYIPEKNEKMPGKWDATGTQFQVPFIFKTLFSHDPIEFKDKCETKTVTTALYLDMNEGLGDDEHDYHFVGRAGQFCPIKPGCGGGLLMREKDGKYYAAGGTKGYRWLESEVVKSLGKENDIDVKYYLDMVDDAVEAISQYGDYEWFIS